MMMKKMGNKKRRFQKPRFQRKKLLIKRNQMIQNPNQNLNLKNMTTLVQKRMIMEILMLITKEKIVIIKRRKVQKDNRKIKKEKRIKKQKVLRRVYQKEEAIQ